jgi:hypothetical protein
MSDLIVILIIILLILLLLVLLVRREPHEVLRTLAERITRVKGSKWFDVRFAGPARGRRRIRDCPPPLPRNDGRALHLEARGRRVWCDRQGRSRSGRS